MGKGRPKGHTDTSQYRFVLNHLLMYSEITPAEAYHLYGVLRLAAIISILRAQGYDISTQRIHHKNKYGHTSNYAKYMLERN